MSDTVTIAIDEIEAVATKIDAGDQLDDHDRVVLRGLLVLAGERVADLTAGEVEGFSLDFGLEGANQSPALEFSGLQLGQSQAGGILFRSCCNGKHYSSATLHVRKAGDKPMDYL